MADAGPVKMMGTLMVAGMASGAAIVGIYLLTAPMIERNRAEALERAIYQVLPGATSQAAFVDNGGQLTGWTKEGAPPKDVEAVYAGFDDGGKFVGFAVPSEGAGFQDTVGLIYGIDPVKRVMLGMRVLQSLETPGLGDKIIKDQAFVGGFEGLAVDPEVVSVKKGAKVNPNEIDSITGATISSKAVVKIINAGNAKWLDRLPKTAEAP